MSDQQFDSGHGHPGTTGVRAAEPVEEKAPQLTSDEVDLLLKLEIDDGMPREQALRIVRQRSAGAAQGLMKRRTAESWTAIRRRIYERDEAICQVCGRWVPFDGEYECGHRVDRMVGGSDLDDNLHVMCYLCNRCKPVHSSLDEYEAWRATGGPLPKLRRVLDTIKRGLAPVDLPTRQEIEAELAEEGIPASDCSTMLAELDKLPTTPAFRTEDHLKAVMSSPARKGALMPDQREAVRRLIDGDYDYGDAGPLLGELHALLRCGPPAILEELMTVAVSPAYNQDARSLALEALAGARHEPIQDAVLWAINSCLSEPEMQFDAIAAAADLSRVRQIEIAGRVADLVHEPDPVGRAARAFLSHALPTLDELRKTSVPVVDIEDAVK